MRFQRDYMPKYRKVIRLFSKWVAGMLVLSMILSLISCGAINDMKERMASQAAEDSEETSRQESLAAENEETSLEESSAEEPSSSETESSSEEISSQDESSLQESSKPELDDDMEDLAGDEEEESSGLPFILMIEETDIDLNSDGLIHYAVKGGETTTEPILIKNGEGEVLAQLEAGSDSEGTINVATQEEGRFILYAESGTNQSSEVVYFVHKPITEAMADELLSVISQLGDYASAASFEDPSSEEALSQIETYLNGLDTVKAVVRTEDDVILYQTVDGLVGAYNLSKPGNGEYLSSGGDHEIEVDDGFEEANKGEGDSKLEDSFILNKVVATNPNAFFISQTYAGQQDEDHQTLEIAAGGIRKILSDACSELGGTVTEGSLIEFLNGDFTDYGFFVLSGHGQLYGGGKDKRYIVELGTPDDITEITRRFRDSFWCEDILKLATHKTAVLDSIRLIYDVSEGDYEHGCLNVTGDYLKIIVQNRLFDNTVVYFNSCCGAYDTQLIDMFLSRGASCFYGCTGDVKMSYALLYFDALMNDFVFNGKSAKEAGRISVGNQGERISDLIDRIMVRTTIEKDGQEIEVYEVLPAFKSWLLDGFVGATLETIEDYNDLDPNDIELLFEVQFDYGLQRSIEENLLIERTSVSTKFYVNGASTVTGTVKTDEVTGNSKPVSGAVVKAFRWLDHTFVEEGSTTTKEDGVFVFNDLPYGLYEFRAEKDGILDQSLAPLLTYRHFYIAKEEVKVTDKPVYFGYTYEGATADEDGNPISGVTVTFKSASGETTSTVTGEYGVWWIYCVGSETFEVSFKHEEYQSQQISVSLGNNAPVRYITLLPKDASVPAHQSIACDRFTTLAVTTDGMVLKTEDPILYGDDHLPVSNVIEVDLYDMTYICLLNDGTVKAEDRRPVVGYFEKNPDWIDIVKVRAGSGMAIGITSDGHVKMLLCPSNKNFTADMVEEWTEIIDVAIGTYYIAGLKKDGTVIWAGRANHDGVTINVSDWKDIIQISGRGDLLVGLTKDGSVLVTGEASQELLSQVRSWKKVKMISASSDHIAVVFRDGTVAAAGNNDFGQCDIGTWKDIIAVYAGETITIGLRSDGTIVAAGNNDHGQSDITSWKNIAME